MYKVIWRYVICLTDELRKELIEEPKGLIVLGAVFL